MTKLLILVALVCLGLVSARRGPPGGGPNRGPPGGGQNGGPSGGGWGGNSLATQLCNNNSLAQSFLTQTLALISQLNANSSFTQVLANRQAEITYLQNANSATLISSNCTQFFAGLNTARQQDMTAQNQQQQNAQSAARQFWAIIKSLLGQSNNGNNNNDSSGDK